jgi:zinc and cadmium transporter
MEYTQLLWALSAGFAVMLVSLSGVITTLKWFAGKVEKQITLLSSFSAGVFLTVGVLLVRELLEHSESVPLSLTSVAFGAIALIVLSRIPEFHHHHSPEENHSHSHSKASVRRILASDALHNVGDGVLIGASFAVSTTLGVVATIGIVVHELLQEISEFFLLRERGLSAQKALKINFLVSSTVLIGIVASFFLVNHEKIESVVIGLSAGAILAVVFHDLIPNLIRTSQESSQVQKHLLVFIIGGFAMFLLSLFIRH